jgi:hypothetical protein
VGNQGWGGREVSDEDWNKEHYFVCVYQSCRFEWYTDDPNDSYCPKCGTGPCCESWHPRRFDEAYDQVTGKNASSDKEDA